jgi:membrane peptidoglycan carboxypeptidase
VAGLIALAVVAASCHVPRLEDEERKAQELPQTSFMLAGDGSVLTTFHRVENRIVVPLNEIPDIVRKAVVAVEDRRFYQHSGIDLRALLRAAYVDATEGHIVEGASTITEQYIKNRYLDSDRTLSRKVKEAVLAWQLERQLTKNQILARYLNTVYFGQGAYGIQAAAKTYFSEPASDLTLQQAALLVALIPAPSAYDPAKNPDLALERRNLVLGILRDQGIIDTGQYQATVARGLGLRLHHRERYRAPYFVDFVEQWLLSNPAFGATTDDRRNLLDSGGLRIYTTLRPRLQRFAEQAIRQILIYKSDPHAAMTVIDPRNGHILAMVGGRDYFSASDPVAQVNLATGGATGRQAGSTFKPFALVAAMLNGIPPQQVYAAPPSITISLPGKCQAPGEPSWSVTNFDGYGAGPMTVEQATINSVNVVYAQIVRDLGRGDPCLGADKVVQAARALGVNSPELMRMGVGEPLVRVPAAVLGAEQVNTVEMASAYATLADVGYHSPPLAVTKVTNADGKVLWREHDRRTIAVDPPVAYVADQILQKVVLEGTGTAAALDRPAIGKTGTAQAFRDAWFVGAVPQLSAAVWVGFPQGEESMVAPRTRLPQVLGGTWPAQIWHLFMTNATRGMPVRDFPQPVLRYVTVRIDATRDCQANRYTPPQVITEVTFLEGTQPPVCTEPSAYQPLIVPSVIGLSVSDAASLLAEAGFQSVAVARASPQPPGTIIGQDPPAGEQALMQSTISLYVAVALPPPCSLTPSPTPSPSPSPSKSAAPALRAGFAESSRTPSRHPSASPAPKRSTGSTPKPTPSASPCPSPTGPKVPAIVPNVIGETREAALAELQRDGFGAAALVRSQCSGGAKGCHAKRDTVWQQSPAAGETLDPGSTVTVWVNPKQT